MEEEGNEKSVLPPFKELETVSSQKWGPNLQIWIWNGIPLDGGWMDGAIISISNPLFFRQSILLEAILKAIDLEVYEQYLSKHVVWAQIYSIINLCRE